MQTSESWWFPRIWAALVLLLISVTLPLWSGFGELDYPSIALIEIPFPAAQAILVTSTIVLIGSLIGIVVAPVRFRWGWWLVAGSLLVSFLWDQHRIQPWAYQTAIYAVIFATFAPRRAQSWLIPLAASVYLYSSAGKFDYQFAHTVGQEFLAVVFRPLGGLPEAWSASQRAKIALCFPAIEFAAGVGLLLPLTRRAAAVMVMLMHASLLLILGPWGLGHSAGVLVWNGALLVQAYLLFWNPQAGWLADPGEHLSEAEVRGADNSSTARPSGSVQRSRMAAIKVLAVCGFAVWVLLAPIFERWGYWDHWTSWALYSPHNSRAEVEVHESVIEDFPNSLRSQIDQDLDGDRWHAIALGNWSLSQRKVPIYPQARYQLAVSHWLARRYQLGQAIRVRQRGVSDRWTGQRTQQQWLGARQIADSLHQFWLTR